MTQQSNERLLPCPIDAGKAEWREHPYRGTGASGMEAPDISIRCTVCGLETTREKTEQWERGKGTYSIREEAEAKLLARWNTRVPAVQDLLRWGTLSMTKRQVIVDFDSRERAEAFFQAMSLYGETTSLSPEPQPASSPI